MFLLAGILGAITLERKWRAEPSLPMKAFWIMTVLLLVALLWLTALRESQLRPHRITRTINGQVLSSYVTTNPVEVVTESWPVLGMDGTYHAETRYKTNQLWTIWPLFR